MASHRIDPRWRLVGGLVLLLGLTLVRGLPAAGVAFVAALLAAVALRIERRPFLERLGVATVGVVPLVIAVPWAGPFVAVKALAFAALVALGMTVAPFEDYVRGARGLGLPATFAHLIGLSHRFALLAFDDLLRLRQMLRVRGFRARADAATYCTLGGLVGTLLVRGGERAERVGAALAARGFPGDGRGLREPQTGWRDVMFVAACVLTASGIVLLDHVTFRPAPLAPLSPPEGRGVGGEGGPTALEPRSDERFGERSFPRGLPPLSPGPSPPGGGEGGKTADSSGASP